MKKKNGFVLVETLIVVLLLTTTLMSLYASFAYIVSKTKERNNNDTIDTLYKTYYVKDLMDVAYASSGTSESYSNSFLYYYLDDDAVWQKYTDASGNSKRVCRTYDYSSGTQSTPSKGRHDIVICDYSVYYGDTPYDTVKKDPIYEAVVAYGIEKIYYVDYSLIANNQNNKKKYAEVLNLFDATSIDYIREQNPELQGDFMIIKYRKSINNSTSHGEPTELDIDSEIFHSSIAMTEITTNSTLAPVYFYSDNDSTSIASDSLYADGAVIPLYNMFGSSVHPGQALIGWTNNTEVDTIDKFNSCIKGDATYSENHIYCYENNIDLKVNEYNRMLYAIWCGDGTINGVLECAVTDSTDTSKNGLFKRTESDGVTTYYYSGTSSSLDNYYVYNRQCFRLISNFGSPSGIKAIYTGTYNESTGCANTGTTSFITSNWMRFANSNYRGFQDVYYMYRSNDVSVGYYSGADSFKYRLNLYSYSDYTGSNKGNPLTLNPDKEVIFAKDATYDKDTDTYTLDSATSVKKIWYGTALNNYSDLSNLGVTGYYFCEDGGPTCKSRLYYLSSVTPKNTYFTYRAYYTTGGKKYNSLGNVKMLLASNISYDSTSNTYSLTGDYIYPTISELFDSSSSNDANIINHPYFCFAVYDETKDDHTNNLQCEKLYKIGSAYSSNINVIYYVNGIMNDTDAYHYYYGDPSLTGTNDVRTISSNAKTGVDNWFKNYIAKSGLNFEEVFDYDVTFCEDSSFNGSFGPELGKTSYTYFDVFRDKNYDISYINNKGYKTCDKWSNYGTNSSNSNGLLEYPSALITGEEIKSIPNFDYLSSGAGYHLMNQINDRGRYYYSSGTSFSTETYYCYYSSSTSYCTGDISWGVRPVVAFKFNAQLIDGNGAVGSPYIIKSN